MCIRDRLEAFVDRYRAAMREAYPPVPGVTADDGGPVTIFPARRLFMAGQKPA